MAKKIRTQHGYRSIGIRNSDRLSRVATRQCTITSRRVCVKETLELMADPAAMKAIRDHRAGKTKFGRIEDIPS